MSTTEMLDAPQAKAARKKASGSSFYLAMRLMPAEERDAMFAIFHERYPWLVGQPFLHGGPYRLLARPCGLGRVEGGQGQAIQLGPAREPVRTQIRQLMIVSGDPAEGGQGRVQGYGPLDILLGNAVDRRHIETVSVWSTFRLSAGQAHLRLVGLVGRKRPVVLPGRAPQCTH